MNQPNPTSHVEPLPSYCLRYGWSADPFSDAADKPPYFIPGVWDQLLDVVQHAYQHENSLIAVIGVPGVGKSVFLEQLLLQIDSSTLTSVLSAHPITLDALINNLSKDLGVALPAGETFEDRFDNLLISIQLTAQTCLLIIDDAEKLPAEVFQQLLYFVEQQTDYQMRLHIILLGTPTLITLLSQTAATRTKNPKIRYVTLEAFTRAETAAYLQHRIKAIDRHSKVPFSAESMNAIHDNASGIPKQINDLAKQLLSQGKMTQTAKKTYSKRSALKWSIRILFTLIILMGTAVLAYQHFSMCCNNTTDENLKINLSYNDALNTTFNDLHTVQLKIPTTYCTENHTYCPLTLVQRQQQKVLTQKTVLKKSLADHVLKKNKTSHLHVSKTKKIVHTPPVNNNKNNIATVTMQKNLITPVTYTAKVSAKA